MMAFSLDRLQANGMSKLMLTDLNQRISFEKLFKSSSILINASESNAIWTIEFK